VASPGEVGAGRRRALELGWQALSRRDRTVAELTALLERRGVEPGDAEAAIDEIAGAGYLDDRDLARRYVEDRRRLDRWGEERIARGLARRGVAAELIEAALERPNPEDELAAARSLLAERMPAAADNDRARSRAFGLLVRRGYAAEVAYEAVRRHEREA
jgi:regulatory protein